MNQQLLKELMNDLNLEQQEAIEYYEEHYQGEFDSLEDWAYQFNEDTGSIKEVAEHLRSYIDWTKYARDAVLGGDIFTIDLDGKRHVFWSH